MSFIRICKLSRNHCVMEYFFKSCVSSYSPLSVCSCLVSRDTNGWLDVLDYNHRHAPRPFLIPRRRNTSPPIKRATTAGYKSLYWRIRFHCDKPTLFLYSWENIYTVSSGYPNPTRYPVFHLLPDPTRFSFENHRVAGNPKYRVLPEISGKPGVSGITRYIG